MRYADNAEQEHAFTLIEVMIVVLIIGILIGIGLPVFLGARTRAQDRAAQSDLRTALVAAKAIYTDNSSYLGATAVALSGVEGALSYVDGAPAGTEVGVSAISASQWAAARLSLSGECFYISDSTAIGTRYGQTAAGCVAPTMALAVSGAWT